MRRSRASYFEQLSTRVFREVRRKVKDAAALDALHALVGEIILELKSMEEDRAALEREIDSVSLRHRDLLDRVPVPCVLTTADGTVAEANQEALTLLYETENRIIGNPFVLWFKDREEFLSTTRLLSHMEAPVTRELRLAPRERRPRDVTVIIQRVLWASTPLFRWFLLERG